MAYVLRYFLNYKDNASGLPVTVNIHYPDFDGVALELIAADSPCTVSELNSDENILSPIRAKEFKIKFITDNLVYPGIADFATNSDNDWKVDILVNGNIWLTGFILTDQISEAWYTDNTNHYIELTATDNLGTLKKLPLKNKSGDNFLAFEKEFLIDIIKGALQLAIEDLPINIFDNLFEVGFYDRNDTIIKVFTESFSATASTKVMVLLIPSINIFPGDTIVITGSVSNNGSFTVVSVADTYFATITVLETVADESNTPDVTWTVTHFAPEIDSYQQCMVDMRTFSTGPDSYEDAYQVLEKILGSRNSVLFQHLGEWHIVRVSELFNNDLINGTRYNINGRMEAISNSSWLADLNESGDIIPVDSFMMKSFVNPVLSNRVVYNYKNFDEFICNELFKRGELVIDTGVLKEYNIDCWSHYQGTIDSVTSSSVIARRRDIIDLDTDVIKESYVFLEHELTGGGLSFLKSRNTQVNAGDKVTLSFARRVKTEYSFSSGEEILGHVILYANDSTIYILDDDGTWYEGIENFGLNAVCIKQEFSSGTDHTRWIERTVESDYMPKTGELAILLWEGSRVWPAGQETHFKDLKVSYRSYLEGKTFVNIEGDYDKYTLPSKLKDTAEYEVFLSDSPKFLFKGALYMSDGVTLTSLWYEMSNPDLIYPIKRFNAIDHYRLSNRNMLKVDGSFYSWIKENPINSIQKITINNGDANKRFMHAFIRDLDTAGSRFSGLLIEVFDPTKDITTEVSTTGPAEPIDVLYNLSGSVGFSFKYFTALDWELIAGNQIKFIGTSPIVTDLLVSLNFSATTVEPGGNNGIFIDLLKNGVAIPGAHYDEPGWTGTTAVSYSYSDLGVTIDPDDYFQLRVQSVDDGFDYDTIFDITGSFSAGSLVAGSSTQTGYLVNAEHEFNYIFKSK